MAPRCGKPMRRCEAANGPMPEEPACARPAGHDGPCRSTPALARKYQTDADRVAAARRAGRYRDRWHPPRRSRVAA